MKNYQKYLISVFCIIMLISIFSLGYQVGKKEENIVKGNNSITSETEIIANETKGEKTGNSISVAGILASYKYVDRDINLEYFYKLNNTSTYEQILEEIGEPNGQFGSGIIYQYYEIDNNLYVSILFSSSENKGYDNITLIRLCTQEEVLDTIYPR